MVVSRAGSLRKRREARRTRWNAGFEGLLDDRQSCCNARRKARAVFDGIVAAFVHASTDEVVGLFPKKACWRQESVSCY